MQRRGDKSISQGAVNLTAGHPARRVLSFTLPLLVGNVFQVLYSWADAITIGNLKGDTVAFTALSASLPVVNLLITVILGFMAGASVIIGQYFGRKRHQDLKKCYSTLLISLLVLSLFFMVVGLVLSKPLLRLIRVDESLIEPAAQYLKIYFIGIIFMVSYNVFAQCLRSLGNSLLPLFVLIFCALLNIVLDIVFVLVFDLGISGVALATLAAQALSSLILFLYIQIRVPLLRLGRRDIKFDAIMLRRTLKIAIPSTIQNICACVGFMFIHALINSKSVNFTAAFGLGARIDELLSQVTSSFGIAITSYAAQNKGKGEIKRISQGFGYTLLIVAVFMGTMCALMLPLKTHIINLFIRMDSAGATDSPLNTAEITRLTGKILNIYVPSFFLLASMQVASGLLRGTGKAATSMSVNIFSLIVRVGAALTLYGFEMGVVFASPIGWGAGMLWGFGAYLKGGWKQTKPDQDEPDLPQQTTLDQNSLQTALQILEKKDREEGE